MIYLVIPAVLAAIYHLLALVAALARAGRGSPKYAEQEKLSDTPGVSILKPVHGRDPHFYEAIRSQADLDYPEYEILFGLNNPQDPALEDLNRLEAEFPERKIRVILSPRRMPNGKVGVLAVLEREARYSVLVVNDSDIAVERDYLRRVTSALAEPAVGLVTCLYRAMGDTWPARWEALGIATDFAPSLLVARMIGVAEFALGSTMALRAADLAKIGGFETIGEYLADDYQLGRRISSRGDRIAVAGTVVATWLSAKSWRDVWRHQVRWSRTIRCSRAAGYYGYVITNATVWALVALCAKAWPVAVAALTVRLLAGIATAGLVLHDPSAARLWFLIPFRDLVGFAIWVAGLGGSTVEWRGEKIRLTKDGRIVERG